LNSRRRRLVAVAALLLFLLGIGVVWYFWPDPHLAHAQELRRQLTDESGRNLSAEQRRDLRQQLGAEKRQLSPEQRRKLWADRKNPFREQVKKYFTLSKPEQTALLDQQLNRMEQWRSERAQEMHTVGQAANGAGPGGGRPADPDQREQRRRERLDQTTPEERAQFAEFFTQLKARRQQRGLSGSGFGGRP
jgi:hypothetical protein